MRQKVEAALSRFRRVTGRVPPEAWAEHFGRFLRESGMGLPPGKKPAKAELAALRDYLGVFGLLVGIPAADVSAVWDAFREMIEGD